MPLRYYLFLALFAPAWIGAQNDSEWTLSEAVTYARENSLQVRRLNNTTEVSRLNLQQSRNNRLPTLNGGTSLNLLLGRSSDPTTNTFEAQNILSQGYQLQGGVTLYDGGFLRNSLRQSEIDLEAAVTDAEVAANDVSLLVANSYLTILLTQEQLVNARTQLELIDSQLVITDAQIRAGSLPAAQRYDLVAQQASNQRTVVDLENQVQLALLDLQLLLELDPDNDFSIVNPVEDFDESTLFTDYDLQEVLNAARQTQPTIRAAELRRTSANIAKDIARAGLRPTLQLFANLSTNYSSIAKDFNNPDETNVELVQGPAVPVVIAGQETTISTFNQTGVVYPNLAYLEQLDQNFSQSVGMSLSVPIYNQNRNRINVQRAELQRLGADIEVTQAENQLRSDIERALGDLRAARQTYRAAEISVDAAQRAYEVADRRFSAGAANSLDLTTAANRLEQARVEFTRSKYQLIFNREVIQFYLGQELSLN